MEHFKSFSNVQKKCSRAFNSAHVTLLEIRHVLKTENKKNSVVEINNGSLKNCFI